LIPMALGFVWYHPKVFGNAWMQSIGMNEASMKGSMATTMTLAIACSMFISWSVNAYAGHPQPGWMQFTHGFFHGAWGTGVPAAVVLIANGLFERRSATNLLINAAYWILAIGLMGGFLYAVAAPMVEG
jgi:peptidoglycan biosynthesis protein MviN/MurJ (putative lipid II flippase)